MFTSGDANKRKILSSDDCNEPSKCSKVARTQSDQPGAINRTSLQSNCENDERASFIEATQTCPQLSNAPKQNFSRSDSGGDGKGSDDANDTKDCDNSDLESFGVHQARSNRQSEALTGFGELDTDQMGQCCPRCEAMTGTQQGISALLSEGGYKHFDWYDIQKSAGTGCALCETIWHVTEHEDWDYEDDGSRTHKEIRVFANTTRLPPSKQPRPPKHPLQDIQLESLEVMIPLDGRLAHGYSSGEILYLAAFEGKLKSFEQSFRAALMMV
jgi:hypothetical protein